MTTYSWLEIPLIAQAQRFSIVLAGVSYTMMLQFHEANGGVVDAVIGADPDVPGNVIDPNVLDGWALSITDANNNPIIAGVPLIAGIDLLYPYHYLGLGGSLLVSVDGDPDAAPGYAGLGTTSHLYFVVASP